MKRTALVLALWLPAIANATPVLSFTGPLDRDVYAIGWINQYGTFSVETSPEGLPIAPAFYGGGARAAFEEPLFSLSTRSTNAFLPLLDLTSASTQLTAIVEDNGTPSGNLISGILTVRAGDLGAPEIGADPGQLLLVGNVLEAFAADSNFSVQMLIQIVQRDPAFAVLGDYVTLYDPMPVSSTWSLGFEAFQPWKRSWSNSDSFDSYPLFKTVRVVEPSAFGLFAAGLIALMLMRRRVPT